MRSTDHLCVWGQRCSEADREGDGRACCASAADRLLGLGERVRRVVGRVALVVVTRRACCVAEALSRGTDEDGAVTESPTTAGRLVSNAEEHVCIRTDAET